MFKLRLCDDGFLASAPQRQSAIFEIPQPADRVWAALTADDTLHWCRALSSVTWTSARPFGEGTTRRVRMSEAPPAARPGNPINALITRSLFSDTRKHFGAT